MGLVLYLLAISQYVGTVTLTPSPWQPSTPHSQASNNHLCLISSPLTALHGDPSHVTQWRGIVQSQLLVLYHIGQWWLGLSLTRLYWQLQEHSFKKE